MHRRTRKVVSGHETSIGSQLVSTLKEAHIRDFGQELSGGGRADAWNGEQQLKRGVSLLIIGDVVANLLFKLVDLSIKQVELLLQQSLHRFGANARTEAISDALARGFEVFKLTGQFLQLLLVLGDGCPQRWLLGGTEIGNEHGITFI